MKTSLFNWRTQNLEKYPLCRLQLPWNFRNLIPCSPPVLVAHLMACDEKPNLKPANEMQNRLLETAVSRHQGRSVRFWRCTQKNVSSAETVGVWQAKTQTGSLQEKGRRREVLSFRHFCRTYQAVDSKRNTWRFSQKILPISRVRACVSLRPCLL